jgi:hypothetical protein
VQVVERDVADPATALIVGPELRPHRREPEVLRPLEVAGLDGGVDGGVALGPPRLPRRLLRRRPLEAARARGGEDERGDPLGMDDREVDRRRAAHRAADERRALDPCVGEHREQVSSVRVRDARLRSVRASVAARVEPEDVVPLGERGELRVPRPRVPEPGVQEDHGFPGARLLDVQTAALDLDEARSGGHPASSNRGRSRAPVSSSSSGSTRV